RVFMELGKRLSASGVISATADVFHLSVGELRKVLSEHSTGSCQGIVEQRQAEIEHFRAIKPPETLGTRSQLTATGESTAGGSEDERFFWLQVHAGSPCIARGPARVLQTLADASSVAPGDILVARTISSSWTPLFAAVAGVVTDTGGTLGHAAV